MKSVFANPFGIALHDTPARELFHEAARPFSHGCVRVEHALELAQDLLGAGDGGSAAVLARALASGSERWVPLPQPVPVHVGYWTAWVDGAGTVQFRSDLYGWDGRLGDALLRD